MKTLQDYIYESIVDDEINEGKIWDAIKKWWNNIFDTSKKKKYNRYNQKIDGFTRNEYIQDLHDNFNIDKLKIKKINPSSLKDIVFPQREQPSKESNIGFWQFTDEKISDTSNFIIYGFVYETEEISDVAALIKVNKEELHGYTEILKLQIVNEFEQVLKLSDLIDFIFDNKKDILNTSNGLILYKDTDKHLYEKLDNDCNFIKETINNKNVVNRTVE